MTDTKKDGKAAVRNAVRGAKAAEKAPRAPGKSSHVPKWITDSFVTDKHYVYQKVNQEEENRLVLCGLLICEAETRNNEGDNWGLEVSFIEEDSKSIRKEIILRSQIIGECTEVRARLARRRLWQNQNKAAKQGFIEYLNSLSSPNRATTVTRIGWAQVKGVKIFVQPDRTYGEAGERVIFQPPDAEQSPFHQAGTLADWSARISRRCTGNSRLLFAVSSAFAATLLGVVDQNGGGFNLRGKAQIGKSTALNVAASVCGGTVSNGAKGYTRTARATENALEAAACMFSDSLFCLDEMSELDSAHAAKVPYMLANGNVKMRANRTGGLREGGQYRLLTLFTGEEGILEKLREAGLQLKAGQEVRLVDIPADAGVDYGIFENIHSEASPHAFAEKLNGAIFENFGTALPAFLERLTREWQSRSDFPDTLRRRMRERLDSWLKPYGGTGSQVHSIGLRFVLVAVAGELAEEWHIVEWPPGEASWGAHKCFVDCLADRGTVGAREDEQAISRVRGFIEKHESARFSPWPELRKKNEMDQSDSGDTLKDDRTRVMNRAGYKRQARRANGEPYWVFFLFNDAFLEALAGLNPRDSTKALIAAGLLDPDATGKSSRSMKVPGIGKVRLYKITLDSDIGTGEVGESPADNVASEDSISDGNEWH